MPKLEEMTPEEVEEIRALVALSCEETGVLIGRGHQSVRNHVKDGSIPGRAIGGKGYIIFADQFLTMMGYPAPSTAVAGEVEEEGAHPVPTSSTELTPPVSISDFERRLMETEIQWLRHVVELSVKAG